MNNLITFLKKTKGANYVVVTSPLYKTVILAKLELHIVHIITIYFSNK